jgi:hypothetical protein
VICEVSVCAAPSHKFCASLLLSSETEDNPPDSIRLAIRRSHLSSSASKPIPKGFYQRHPVSGHSSTLSTSWPLFCCSLRLHEGAHAKHDVEQITLTLFHHSSWLVKSIPHSATIGLSGLIMIFMYFESTFRPIPFLLFQRVDVTCSCPEARLLTAIDALEPCEPAMFTPRLP